MSGNYCSSCGTPIIGSGSCKKRECVKAMALRANTTSSESGGGYPTMDQLKAELSARIENMAHRDGYPECMPKDPEQAVAWWLQMQEKPSAYESPQQVSNGWEWEYARRVKYNLAKFLRQSAEFQSMIVSAREDGIFWRGDDQQFFMRMTRNVFTMRDVVAKHGMRNYVGKVVAQMRKLASKFAMRKPEPPKRKIAA